MRVCLSAFAPFCACAIALTACQDSNSSNAERSTHMGDVQAAVFKPAALTPFAALPAPPPGADPPPPMMAMDAGPAKDAAPAPMAHPHP